LLARRQLLGGDRYKIQIGDETFHVEEGGFAYLPSGMHVST